MSPREPRQVDFTSLFYHAEDFAVVTDERGAIVAFNRGAQKLTVYDEREVIGLTLPQICDDGTTDELERLFKPAGRPTSQMHVGLRLMTKGGRRLTVRAAAFPLFDETGAHQGWIFLGQDLRGAVAESRRARSVLGALVDSLHASVFSFDLAGSILTWSRACDLTFGYPRSEVEGKMSARRLFQDPRRLDEILESVGIQGVFAGELIALRKDGTPGLGQVLLSPLRDADERVVGHTCIFQDVSEQRRVEQFVKVLFDHAGEAIFFVDAASKRIIDANARALELHGYTREEFLRLTTLDLHSPGEDPKRLREIFDILDRTGRYQSDDAQHARKDGTVFPVSLNVRRVTVAGTTYGVCIAQDLTEKKKAQEEILFRKTLLECQSEASIDGILLVDPAGKMISFNRRFVEMWGIPPQVVAGRSDEAALKSVLDNLVQPEEFLTRVRHLYEHRDEESREEIALKDGRMFDRYSAPVKSAGGIYYGRVWYFRDITERDAFRRLSQKLTEPLDVKELAHAVARESRRLFRHDAFLLYVLAESGDAIQGVYAEDTAPGASEPNEVVFQQGFRSTQEDSPSVKNEPTLINRTDPAPPENLTPFGYTARRSRSLMFTPIRWKGEFVGTVSVQSYTPGLYGDRELALLQTFADQCGGALARLRAEEALHKTREQLETRVRVRSAELTAASQLLGSVVAGAPLVLFSINKDGVFTLSEGRGLEALGLKPSEVVGSSVFEVYKDAPQILDHIRRALAGEAFTEVVTVQGGPGAGLVFETRYTPLRGVDGRPAGVIGVAADITERVRAQDAAQRYLDIAGVILLVLGRDGRVDLINQKGCSILGTDEKSILGKDWFEHFIPANARGVLRERFRDVMDGKKAISEYYENSVQTSDGKERLIAWHNTVLRDDKGDIVATLSSGEDITERRRAEEALQRQTNLHETLLQAQSDLEQGLVIAEDERILYVNDAFCRISGYDQEELLAIPSYLDIIPAEERERVEDRRRRRLRGERIEERYESAILHKSGRRVEAEIAVKMFEAEGRRQRVVMVRDITARREAADALRRAHDELERRVLERTADLTRANETLSESERKYAALIREAPDPIVFLDGEGIVRAVNPAAERVVGQAAPEMVGKHFAAVGIVAQASLPRSVDEFARVVSGETRPPFEIDIVSRLGETYTMEINPRLIRRGEEIAGVQIMFRDVTERKRTEQALRTSEEKFRAVAETAVDAIVSADAEGNIIYFNKSAERIFGHAWDEVIGKPLTILMPEHFREGHLGGFRRYRETGEARVIGRAVEMAGRAKDGRELPLEISLAAWKTADGRPFFTGILRDITERKRAEEALRESEARVRTIIEGTTDAVFIKDRRGRYVMINPAGAAFLGRTAGEILGKTDVDLFTPETGRVIMEHDRRIVEGGAVRTFEEVGASAGVERVYLSTKCPYRSPAGEVIGLIGICRDITEQKRSEREIRRAYEDLKRTQDELVRAAKLASVGMLVSGVAHEINNPINVIYGNLKLLKDAVRDGAPVPKIRAMLRDMETASERARVIIQEFRNFARDTRSAEPADLNVCLEEALSILKKDLGRRVKVVKEFAKLPPVKCLRGQIVQVFFNLMRNGAEAIEKKGTLTLRTRREGGWVAVEVADTGRGMPEEVRRRLFEPFFTTKEIGQGLGLGLSISATIVQNHGGRISCESTPGRGTTFRIELPLGKDGAE